MARYAKTSGLLVGVALLASHQLANATALSFSDFSSSAGLQLNGSASIVPGDNVLRLTPASYNQSGSAFSTSTVSLASDASFSTAFQFRITDSGGICDGDGCGADGLVFTAQTVSNTAGGAGGGIGYSGLANSLGIEFDTWNNGWWDDYNGNHVGIDINGNIDSALLAAIGTRMNNGNIWSAWVDYNGATDLLEVRLAEGAGAVRPGLAILDYTVDLPSILGVTDAYFGFTSGTGSAYGNHDILSWELEAEYDPIGKPASVPEPASMLLLGLGFLGMRIARRKM